MYFWTCWYTKRFRLIIYLTLATALTILGSLPEALEYVGGHWKLAVMSPARIVRIWDAATSNTTGLLIVVMLFAAADLGALALTEDSKRREYDFLLTRPREREYFVRTSWLAGLLELIPLLAAPILAAVITMAYMTREVHAASLIGNALMLFVMAAAMYAAVFLVSALSGTAQNGLQIAGFITFLYAGFNYARNEAWFYADYRPVFWGAFDWYTTPHQLFPFANLLLVIGLTVASLLIVQIAFRQKDL